MTAPADEDEVLPGSDVRPPSRRTRLVLGLLAGAVAVVVVVVVVARDPGDRPAAVGSRPPATAGFVAPTASAPPSVSLPPGPCSEDCRVSTAVPSRVRTALDAAYPGAVVVQVVTYYDSREVLVERRVLAGVGDRTVRILLTRQTPQPVLRQHSTVQGHDVRRFRVSLGADTVDVAVERLAGRSSDPAPLQRLARDPRLLAAR